MVKQIFDNIFGVHHKHVSTSVDHSGIGILLGGEIHESSRQEHIVNKLQIVEVADYKTVEFDILSQQAHQVLAVDGAGNPVYGTV